MANNNFIGTVITKLCIDHLYFNCLVFGITGYWISYSPRSDLHETKICETRYGIVKL